VAIARNFGSEHWRFSDRSHQLGLFALFWFIGVLASLPLLSQIANYVLH